MRNIRRRLASIKYLRDSYDEARNFRKSLGVRVNPEDSLEPYFPGSSGGYKAQALSAVECASQFPALLFEVAKELATEHPMVIETDRFVQLMRGDSKAIESLSRILTSNGSDKATKHDYHKVYSTLFKDPSSVRRVFEIGLGTNSGKILSTMGINATPGASIRSWRQYFPNAEVIGADVDRDILFSDDRIITYFLDQTKEDSFRQIDKIVGTDFDLMIDDGLHALHANLRSLRFFLPKLSKGGWAIIEDITESTIPVWGTVGLLMSVEYKCHLIKSSNRYMFAVNRLNARPTLT